MLRLLFLTLLWSGSAFGGEESNGKIDLYEHFIHEALYLTDTTGNYVVDSRIYGVAPGMPYSVLKYDLPDGHTGLIPLTNQMRNAYFIKEGEWISWELTLGLYFGEGCDNDYAVPEFYEDTVVLRRTDGANDTYTFFLLDKSVASVTKYEYYSLSGKSCNGPYIADIPLTFYYIASSLGSIPDMRFTISHHD